MIGGWAECERPVHGTLNTGRAVDPPRIETVPPSLAQLPVLNRIHAWAMRRHTKATRLIEAPRPVALWHLASLDAPTVAVVWSLAFAWAGGAQLSGRVPLVLALTVWCAYVCDRLLDARASLHSSRGATQDGLLERHFFHWRHRRLLAPLAVAAACVAGAAAVTLLQSFVRERGLVLAAAAMVYFSGVHAAPRVRNRRLAFSWPVSKELLVAVLFTAGCILPAWSRLHASGAQDFSRLWFWIPAIYFAGLAWLNCSSIARWECGDESGINRFDQEGRTYFEHTRQRTNLFAALPVALAGVMLAAIASASHPRSAAVITAGAASALLLELLDLMRARLTPLALRAAADLVLLTPILLFLR